MFAKHSEGSADRRWSFDGVRDDESIVPRLRELFTIADSGTMLPIEGLAFLACVGYAEDGLARGGLTWSLVASRISCFTGEPPTRVLARHGVTDPARFRVRRGGETLPIGYPTLTPVELIRSSAVIRSDFYAIQRLQDPADFQAIITASTEDMTEMLLGLATFREAHARQLQGAARLLLRGIVF